MDSRIAQPMGQSHDRQPVGTVHGLLGNYRILGLLGQGGFADVYLGEHIHLHTQAAIKVLQVRLVESNIQSFLNEARTIAHLVHPYIIRVLDFGVEANTPFLVMDYAPQGTFRQRFLRGKPLPPTALFPYIKQAASALQYAHDKKLIHRDVKPENMLLGPRDEILLSDFGFALIQSSIPRTSSETAGTAAYMAPEQLQGKPQPASDQYSLAVIAYEWLAGICPFQGTFMELASQHVLAPPPSLIQRVPGLSAQIAHVVMTALAKDPNQRFPTVRDFARALEHACLASNNASASSSLIVPPPFLARTEASQAGIGQPGASPLSTSVNSAAFTPFSQGVSNAVQSSQSNLRPLSSQQSVKPATSSTGQTAANRFVAEGFSLSGLRSLRPSDRGEFTNTGQLSPLKALEQSPPSAHYRSQSQLPVSPELPPLPQQPFLAAELARQNRQAPRLSQAFPGQPSTTIGTRSQSLSGLPSLNPASLSRPDQSNSASLSRPDQTVSNERLSPSPSLSSVSEQKQVSQSTRLERGGGSSTLSKSSTSRALQFFVIFMLALIIGSTAILITLTHNRDHGNTLGKQQMSSTHANATATVAPQQTPVASPTNQNEQNPYGNHNGIIVLNNPLNQQDPQMQWDELSGMCTFTDASYHVVASAQSQGFTLCNANASNYSNFVYQVQMTFTKVTSAVGGGGLVFRENKANHQFYFFEILTNGNYTLYRCPGPNRGPCPILSATGGTRPIPSFHTDLGQPNTIALVANGTTINIYVNNQLVVGPIVDTVTDPNYSHGIVGVMARQLDLGAVSDVSFSNIKIWQS